MKTNNRIAALLLLFASLAANAYDVTDYFTMPEADGHVFAIDHNARLDMNDYYDAGMSTPTPIANDMQAHITEVSADGSSMSWALSNGLDYSLSAINKGKKTLLLLIETVSMPERDSRLMWFDSSWNAIKVPADMPALNDWLTPEGLKNRDYIVAWLPYVTATAQKTENANELIFTHTLNQRYVASDDTKRLETWFKPSITVRL